MDLTTAGRRVRALLETIATVLVIVVGVVVLYRIFEGGRTPPRSSARLAKAASAPLPTDPLSIEGAAVKGSKNAKVAIIEYTDFQCPYCGQFARETLPELEKRYFNPGLVLFAFQHLPLERIHPFAAKAGESVECAGRQGRFWEMHDRLFTHQTDLDRPTTLSAHARALNLNVGQFTTCLKGQATDKIRSDASTASRLAVSGTPTFFIGLLQPDGRVKVVERLSGAQPTAQFDRILTRLLDMKTG